MRTDPDSHSAGQLLLFTGILAAIICGCSNISDEDNLVTAEKLFQQGDLNAAEELLLAIPQGSDRFPDASLTLAKIAVRRRSSDRALEYLHRVPRDGSRISISAAVMALDLELRNCRLSEAASSCRYLLQHEQGNPARKSMLATILAVGGDRSGAEELLLQMLSADELNIKDLVLLTQRERLPPETRHLVSCSDYDGDDPLTNFALAVEEIEQERRADARRRLTAAVARKPAAFRLQALLGELLLDEVDPEQLRTWARQLPEVVLKEPEILYVFGLIAAQQQQTQFAQQCFLEILRKDPLHRRAMFQLARALAAAHPQDSALLQRRADSMLRYAELMERVMNRAGSDIAGFAELLRILLDSGRTAEAAAWVRMDNDRHGRSQLSAAEHNLISQFPTKTAERLQPAALITRQLQFQNTVTPEPAQLRALVEHAQQRADGRPQDAGSIRFTDQSATAGVKFTFHSGSRGGGAVRVFESTGGGTAVCDFDLDGLPDLMFTQGEPWPIGASEPAASVELRDQLLRGTPSGFRNCSEKALPDDDHYGQGVSAADFNNDGFTDLYIAGIGINRLLLNNGDGTFQEITESAQLQAREWTSSCLMMDLTADGIPDLFDVNYLSGDDVFLVECGESRCSVLAFAGAEDCLLVGTGDGRFSAPFSIPADSPPKGLGITAIPQAAGQRPFLFIANDQVPNFLLVPDGETGFREEAAGRGLAVNSEGRPTACMGIAAGDFDVDGRTDLFVTNFEGEANCLYLQRTPGLFEDAILGSGLQLPGLPWVGWGTQTIDLQNNGLPDLVVANGHVADFSNDQITSLMPLQLFRNSGNAGFQQIEDHQNCPLLQPVQLGRSVAVLDWNQDGLQDFVVSCTQSNAILGTNHSSRTGHSIRLRLVGTESPRDCSGIRIKSTQPDRTSWHTVSGGDGFQATNERIVHIGLGQQTAATRIEVYWATGRVSVFSNLTADATYAICEHRDSALLLPK